LPRRVRSYSYWCPQHKLFIILCRGESAKSASWRTLSPKLQYTAKLPPRPNPEYSTNHSCHSSSFFWTSKHRCWSWTKTSHSSKSKNSARHSCSPSPYSRSRWSSLKSSSHWPKPKHPSSHSYNTRSYSCSQFSFFLYFPSIWSYPLIVVKLKFIRWKLGIVTSVVLALGWLV
jgi:hypothetical protein